MKKLLIVVLIALVLTGCVIIIKCEPPQYIYLGDHLNPVIGVACPVPNPTPEPPKMCSAQCAPGAPCPQQMVQCPAPVPLP